MAVARGLALHRAVSLALLRSSVAVVSGLRDILDAATPHPWSYRADDGMVQDAEKYHVVQVVGSPSNPELAASGHLAALAPELAALCLDMGEELRKRHWPTKSSPDCYCGDVFTGRHTESCKNIAALLARLDRPGAT